MVWHHEIATWALPKSLIYTVCDFLPCNSNSFYCGYNCAKVCVKTFEVLLFWHQKGLSQQAVRHVQSWNNVCIVRLIWTACQTELECAKYYTPGTTSKLMPIIIFTVPLSWAQRLSLWHWITVSLQLSLDVPLFTPGRLHTQAKKDSLQLSGLLHDK